MYVYRIYIEYHLLMTQRKLHMLHVGNKNFKKNLFHKYVV